MKRFHIFSCEHRNFNSFASFREHLHQELDYIDRLCDDLPPSLLKCLNCNILCKDTSELLLHYYIILKYIKDERINLAISKLNDEIFKAIQEIYNAKRNTTNGQRIDENDGTEVHSEHDDQKECGTPIYTHKDNGFSAETLLSNTTLNDSSRNLVIGNICRHTSRQPTTSTLSSTIRDNNLSITQPTQGLIVNPNPTLPPVDEATNNLMSGNKKVRKKMENLKLIEAVHFTIQQLNTSCHLSFQKDLEADSNTSIVPNSITSSSRASSPDAISAQDVNDLNLPSNLNEPGNDENIAETCVILSIMQQDDSINEGIEVTFDKHLINITNEDEQEISDHDGLSNGGANVPTTSPLIRITPFSSGNNPSNLYITTLQLPEPNIAIALPTTPMHEHPPAILDNNECDTPAAANSKMVPDPSSGQESSITNDHASRLTLYSGNFLSSSESSLPHFRTRPIRKQIKRKTPVPAKKYNKKTKPTSKSKNPSFKSNEKNNYNNNIINKEITGGRQLPIWRPVTRITQNSNIQLLCDLIFSPTIHTRLITQSVTQQLTDDNPTVEPIYQNDVSTKGDDQLPTPLPPGTSTGNTPKLNRPLANQLLEDLAPPQQPYPDNLTNPPIDHDRDTPPCIVHDTSPTLPKIPKIHPARRVPTQQPYPDNLTNPPIDHDRDTPPCIAHDTFPTLSKIPTTHPARRVPTQQPYPDNLTNPPIDHDRDTPPCIVHDTFPTLSTRPNTPSALREFISQVVFHITVTRAKQRDYCKCMVANEHRNSALGIPRVN
jgi:hypothetical protein